MNYSIRIEDQTGGLIGERLHVSCAEVQKYFNKGFKIFNIETHDYMTEDNLYDSLGISDGGIITG